MAVTIKAARSGSRASSQPPAPGRPGCPEIHERFPMQAETTLCPASETVSSNSGIPSSPRAKIAPRVASMSRLLGHIRVANLIIDFRRFDRLPVGVQTLGTQHTPFGNRRPNSRGRGRQSMPQRLERFANYRSAPKQRLPRKPLPRLHLANGCSRFRPRRRHDARLSS